MVDKRGAVAWRLVTVSFALFLLTAATVSPVAAGGSETVATTEQVVSPSIPGQSSLEDVQKTLERIDDFLETVVDLMETISRLTGEGGEVGED